MIVAHVVYTFAVHKFLFPLRTFYFLSSGALQLEIMETIQ